MNVLKELGQYEQDTSKMLFSFIKEFAKYTFASSEQPVTLGFL
jgi:hypothetical protein